MTLALYYDALTDVSVTGCSDVTDAGVSALAFRCRGLTRVNFTGCCAVSDAAVIALASKCKGLLSVNFQFCGDSDGEITDDSVANLSECCPHLAEVSIKLPLDFNTVARLLIL